MKMKQIIYFTLLAVVLTACNDDFYSEGDVKTLQATDINEQTAILHGKVTVISAGRKTHLEVIERGFDLGTNINSLDIHVSDQIGGEGVFSCNVSDLLPNTKYYVRAYAQIHIESAPSYSDGNHLFYGNMIEFTTVDGAIMPSVITYAASNITANSVTLNGTILTTGYPAYSERGFVYGTHQNPKVDDAIKKVVSGSGTGTYFADITGLTENTVYYACAYATNGAGTAYGKEISFTPTPNYIILTAANLMVQREDISVYSLQWNSAKNLVENSIVGGYINWRLPTRDELAILYNEKDKIGGFRTNIVTAVYDTFYWSSESYNNNNWWGIYFYNGSAGYLSSSGYARAVRDLQ